MDFFIILLMLFGACVQGAAGAYIMKTKDRSEGGGFALGFLLGTIGLLIALCLEAKHSIRRAGGAAPSGPKPGGPAPKPMAPFVPTETFPNSRVRHWI